MIKRIITSLSLVFFCALFSLNIHSSEYNTKTSNTDGLMAEYRNLMLQTYPDPDKNEREILEKADNRIQKAIKEEKIDRFLKKEISRMRAQKERTMKEIKKLLEIQCIIKNQQVDELINKSVLNIFSLKNKYKEDISKYKASIIQKIAQDSISENQANEFMNLIEKYFPTELDTIKKQILSLIPKNQNNRFIQLAETYYPGESVESVQQQTSVFKQQYKGMYSPEILRKALSTSRISPEIRRQNVPAQVETATTIEQVD